VLALPEVMLGLLPAGGGTQRLLERTGLQAGLPLLLTGKRLRARKAYRLGIVDALTTPGGLAETAALAARKLADGELSRRERDSLTDRLLRLGPAYRLVLKRARESVRRRTRGLYPAPEAILDCVEQGLSRGREAGFAAEAEHFSRLAVGPEARSLIYLFLASNALKKLRKGAAPAEIRRLGILGAGFMGAGIAGVSLGRYPVVLRDISEQALGAGVRGIVSGLRAQVRSGAITRNEADRRRARLWPTLEVDDLRGCDLVIEAVFEDLELKRRVVAETEERIAEDAVFASNTSALPISEIARDARHPERILGMHYFSPVHKMQLVEIVRADCTSDRAVDTACALAVSQGKSVIVVKDRPGFYTTRILAIYLNEAMLALAEGAAIDAVDRALKDFGYPVGPLALLDEVGIDVGAHVSEFLGQAFAERQGAPSDALQKLFNAGYRGRKNRRGFYLYPEQRPKGPRPVNEEVCSLIGAAPRRKFSPVLLARRIALTMVNEAIHCLQEGVIASPRDGDVGAVFGLGFPPFRGGPLRYVDSEGAATIVDWLDDLAQQHGPRFQPAELLRGMARTGKRFHDGSKA